MEMLSIVVPCFNEAESVGLFLDEIEKVLSDSNWEVIFINDGSTDDTLKNIKKLACRNSKIKYISFSRNFGKEAGLYAGLKNASGDVVCVMDVDLQDPPALLPEMIRCLDGADIVATRRVDRKGELPIRSFFARMFYRFINRVSDLELVDGARDYRVMKRSVVDAILELEEYNRFSKGLFEWVGFKTEWIEYENVERVAGETSWSFWGLLAYSIEGIVAFTAVPLSVSTFFGILFSIIAFIMIVFIVVRNLIFSNPVAGWASTVCIILLIGGIQLFSIGILGKYLEKTYTEVKNRPIYITEETNIED